MLRRSEAQAGEALMVMGSLGLAAAGFLVLEDAQLSSQLDQKDLAQVIAAQRNSTPRIAAGQWLAEYGVKTSIDISDGLAADIAHICTMSNTGATISAESLPILSVVTTLARLANRNPLELAVFGGEDYELAFTIAAERATDLAQDLYHATGARATAIGTITHETGLFLSEKGNLVPLSPLGWDHLRAT
jgi:thiamine-monophosphate kinase